MERSDIILAIATQNNIRPKLSENKIKETAQLVANHLDSFGGGVNSLVKTYSKVNELLLSDQELIALNNKKDYEEQQSKVSSIENSNLSRLAKDLALRRIQDI